MALLVDASALYAQADADEPQHAGIRRILLDEREELVTSELIVAEADYLILSRLGPEAESLFLDDLAAGTFVVECLHRSDIETARVVVDRYRDLRLGLADASLVVLAQRHSSVRLLTLDERAFRVVTPLQGGAFTVLPADREGA